MSNFLKNNDKLDMLNIVNESSNYGTLPKVTSNQGTYLTYYITYDIINTILSKLTNPDLFNESIGAGLQEAMEILFTTNKFKGNMFFDGDKLIAVVQGDIVDDRLKDFRKLEVDINSSVKIPMFNILKEIGVHIDRILSNENTNIALAGTLIFSMEQLRTRVSSDIGKSVFDTSLSAIEDSKESNLMIIDSKDTISMMGTDLSSNNKISLEFATEQMVRATGFPLSYFTGIFENGLGSTSENEAAMLDRALRRIFLLYFKKFFMYIDKSIEIEKDLSIAISNAQGLIDLAQYDSNIDITEIYRRLGIPLKS
jgi:hypothetical protein